MFSRRTSSRFNRGRGSTQAAIGGASVPANAVTDPTLSNEVVTDPTLADETVTDPTE